MVESHETHGNDLERRRNGGHSPHRRDRSRSPRIKSRRRSVSMSSPSRGASPVKRRRMSRSTSRSPAVSASRAKSSWRSESPPTTRMNRGGECSNAPREHERARDSRRDERSRGATSDKRRHDRGHRDQSSSRSSASRYWNRDRPLSPPAHKESRLSGSKRSSPERPYREEEVRRRSRDRQPLPSQLDSLRKETGFIPRNHHGRPRQDDDHPEEPAEKEKINLRPTGILAQEANTLQLGTQKITLKYHQPPEARKPDPGSQQWRLYVFKGEESIENHELWHRSCWLIGRERAVADLWVQSPGVSSQHAVLQFRAVDQARGVGRGRLGVKLYVLDLESSNGTVLNGQRVPASRYVEVRHKDVLKFGGSEREYVVMLPPTDKASATTQ